MMTLKQVRDALKGRNLSEVARDTSLHYQMVWRIANGVDNNPQYKTLEKLDEYLASEEA